VKLADLQNLDPNNIGGWPWPIKLVIVLLVCAAVLGAGYYSDTQDQVLRLEREQRNEQSLKSTFQAKQRKAANLVPLKQLLARIKESFQDMLRLLPNKTQIEEVLVQISQSGLASGLEFELFKPVTEELRDFYAIRPIKIRVTGTYNQFGEFVSRLAKVERVVTQHDVRIKRVDAKNPTQLVMESTAKTYRYLDEEEQSALKEAAKKK